MTLPLRLEVDRISSPIGDILLVTDEAGVLRALDFHDFESRMRRLLRCHYGNIPLPDSPAPAQIRNNLLSYFHGDLGALNRIRWATAGSGFQRSVWNHLVSIAPGETRSYGEIARRLGHGPEVARAVGWANGSNPIALVVPCHRVIGTDGKLTGYAGGLHRKHWMLRHEGAQFAEYANRDLFETIEPPAVRRSGATTRIHR